MLSKNMEAVYGIPGGTHDRDKKILLRVASGYPIRSISRSLGIYKDTIKTIQTARLSLVSSK